MAEPSMLSSDCWYGVQDPRKRKQIQDRLAQRARRKRLREAKHQSPGRSNDSPATPSSQQLAIMASPDRSPLTTAVYSMLTPDLNHPADRIAAQVPLNVYAAIYQNGLILGLPCATIFPCRSKAAPNAPASLQPSQLQLSTIHLPWIDRFPFPKMRDNMIRMEQEINAEELLSDLFNMKSFDIKPGRPSWDPDAYIIDKGFAKKWGFLWR